MIITLLLTPLGVEKTIAVAAILSIFSGLLLAISAHRILAGGALLLIIALAFLFPRFDSLLPFQADPGDATGFYQLVAVKNKDAGGAIEREFSEWNIVAKIDVWKQKGKKLTVAEETDYRLLTVDSGAATVLTGDPGIEKWGQELFEETAYGLAYVAKPNPDQVLVIGTGGGTDVQTALHWGARNITAVEINSSTIGLVKKQYGEFLKWPLSEKVSIIHEDGRSFVKHTQQRYDVIQLTGVDTLTVNATGALNMVEEYLYTVEAFEDYLSVLKPDGVLAIIRPFANDIRLMAIATEALLRQGVTEPQDHIATCRQGNSALILVSRNKLTNSQIDAISTLGERKEPNRVFIPPYETFNLRLNQPFKFIYLPGRLDRSGYKAYFDSVTSDAVERQNQLELKAISTDDRPFFMLLGAIKGHTVSASKRLLLFKQFFLATVVFALVCILLPVMVFRRTITSYRSLSWIFPYFFLIGLCFMMFEIGIINWFSIFVGSPGASTAVVLTSLLLSSGVGSYVSEFIKVRPELKIALATGMLVISSLALRFFSPVIFDECWKAGFGQVLRGVIAGGMIVPMGFAMGWFFPTGLRMVDLYLSDRHLVPWAISINSFASVLGTIAALPLTVYFGFSFLFLVTLIGYMIAGGISLSFLWKKV